MLYQVIFSFYCHCFSSFRIAQISHSMIGPYELDILLFLELQAEVEASSVDLGQAFINEYASFRVGLVVRAQPMTYSVSGLPGAEPCSDGRLQVFMRQETVCGRH